MCLYQTPGQRPPRITGRFVNTGHRVDRSPERARPVQISWGSRWFCRSMFVEDSQSRRFKLSFGLVFLRPILAQDLPRNYFFRFFLKVGNLKKRSCAHCERYRKRLASIFEIGTFSGSIAFSLSSVYDLYLFWKCGTSSNVGIIDVWGTTSEMSAMLSTRRAGLGAA